MSNNGCDQGKGMRFVGLFAYSNILDNETFQDVALDKEGSIGTDIYGISRENFFNYRDEVIQALRENPNCLLSQEESTDEGKGTLQQFATLVVQDLLEAVTIWGNDEVEVSDELKKRAVYYAGNVRITFDEGGRVFFVKSVSPEFDVEDDAFIQLLGMERCCFLRNMIEAGVPSVEKSPLIFHLDDASRLETVFRIVGSASGEMLTFEGPRSVYYNISGRGAYWRASNTYLLFDSRFFQALSAFTVIDWRLTTREFSQYFSWAASPLMDPSLLTCFLTVLNMVLTPEELSFFLIDRTFYEIFATPQIPDIRTIHNGQTPITNHRNCSLDDPRMRYYFISVMRNLVDCPLGWKLRKVLNVQMADPKHSLLKRSVYADNYIAQFFIAMLYRRFLIEKMRQGGRKLRREEEEFLHKLNKNEIFFAALLQRDYATLFPEELSADEF